MFINLRKALDRRCISLREYADFLGISEAAVQDKLEGGKDFTYWETVLPELPSVSLHMAMGRKGTS